LTDNHPCGTDVIFRALCRSGVLMQLCHTIPLHQKQCLTARAIHSTFQLTRLNEDRAHDLLSLHWHAGFLQMLVLINFGCVTHHTLKHCLSIQLLDVGCLIQ